MDSSTADGRAAAPERAPGDESPAAALTTSPLLFGYRGRDGRLAAYDARGGARFRFATANSAALVMDFLDPRGGGSDTAAATHDELAQARAAGMVVDVADYDRLSLWERHGWSRAAYLTLGQMDIDYLERPSTVDEPDAVRMRRRIAIEQYDSEGAYPEPALLAQGAAVALPDPKPLTPRLSALTDRRSVRAFSATPPVVEQMAAVLHSATVGLRVLAEYRRAGQPAGLLNSFQSWAHLMVVVQRVDGVAAGVYEYDPFEHRLVEHAEAPTDSQLRACVQGQGWVLGAGFVVFLVADMRGYAWIYRHSRAYMHLFMQAGEMGQELLMAATSLGLGGWTTPAVHESRTAAVLGLADDGSLEAISMTKLGRRASAPGGGV